MFVHRSDAAALNMNKISSDDDDDDGWGNTSSDISTTTDDSSSGSSSGSSSDRDLSFLKKSESVGGRNKQRTDLTGKNEPPERDLFVPIFAILSLSGLVGAYAFESARLYLRGEIYLPWDQ
eukprot:CAMPEP_0195515536 /NCGR_PEP_ID=MMETSP0794_2-20130614/6568_1 /TAXON_ID=515487 /ORGANISM="Stephanopyxis turris, Strain CCMP 815" /LENGTH=120 /DNA_ID=CAMNT_0040643969 /DNA_START=36 /DNA_END=398 /DNA_ORIENTATION=-